MIRDLDLRPLYDPHVEVEGSDGHDRLNRWLEDEARSLWNVAQDMMDAAADSAELGRARAAGQFAERAIDSCTQSPLVPSTAVAGIVRAWNALDLYPDPVDKMRVRLISFLPAVDALATLVRNGS